MGVDRFEFITRLVRSDESSLIFTGFIFNGRRLMMNRFSEEALDELNLSFYRLCIH